MSGASGPVGLFGLGLIGTALARNIIADGGRITGFDPDPAARAAFGTFGGTPAESAAGVWAQGGIALIAVFDTSQVAQVLAGAPQGWSGIAVIASTCEPEGIDAIARARPDLALVEATISGSSGEVAARGALFLLGGAPGPVAQVTALLAPLGRGCRHVGAFGNATRAKLAVNLILGLNRAALAEGLTLAGALGLDPAQFLEVAKDSAAASAVMSTKGARMVSGDFTAQGRIRQSAKDFDLILAQAGAAGGDLTLARGYAALMADCIDAGEGDLDNAAVVAAVRRRFAVLPAALSDEATEG